MSLDEEPHCPTSLRSRSKRLGSVPSRGLDLSTSIVPEDLEYQHPQQPQSIGSSLTSESVMESSLLFRKRSSSLPRILPPILDRDQDNEEDDALGLFDDISEVGGRLAALKQMDATSNLVVREMQKFVCRFASDVSQVLPLPLPANSRQQNRVTATTVKAASAASRESSHVKHDWKHTQVIMASLAKLHAISYAIRQKSPGLFQEIAASLQASSG